jgi:SAM-dependent methyltransferase
VDSLIKRFAAEPDGDLMLCPSRGIAYQRDMTIGRVQYGDAYLPKVAAYDGSEIAQHVNAGRKALLDECLKPGATVLDYGSGTGSFVRVAAEAGYEAKGFEVMPKAAAQLKEQELYADDPHQFDAVCFWDALEHIENPHQVLQTIKKGSYTFVSLPVFEDLIAIRESRHYRPGEHLYYWTVCGFIDWMALHGFRLLSTSAHETLAGRDSIGAFAFRKDLPDYHDHLAAYQEIHSTRHYGSSSAELHLKAIAKVVRKLGPRSILDYGCGRSDLVTYFYKDGERRVEKYDPSIPAYKDMPTGMFDLVLCCDVLEHIPMRYVDRVLAEVHAQSSRAIFTISTKPSRAKLPDGRNAHVTLLQRDEWLRWISSLFGPVQEIETEWEHEMMVVAG